jgi:hypothetical protein
MVTTDLFGRGIDVERVNIVINYDFPQANDRGESYVDSYLHRIGRAGRFGTKGMAISFVSGEEDEKAFEEVQQVFADVIPELPDTIDQAEYSTLREVCRVSRGNACGQSHRFCVCSANGGGMSAVGLMCVRFGIWLRVVVGGDRTNESHAHSLFTPFSCVSIVHLFLFALTARNEQRQRACGQQNHNSTHTHKGSLFLS